MLLLHTDMLHHRPSSDWRAICCSRASQALRVMGALDARAVAGAEAVLDGLAVENAGWVLEPLPGDGDARASPCIMPPTELAFPSMQRGDVCGPTLYRRPYPGTHLRRFACIPRREVRSAHQVGPWR